MLQLRLISFLFIVGAIFCFVLTKHCWKKIAISSDISWNGCTTHHRNVGRTVDTAAFSCLSSTSLELANPDLRIARDTLQFRGNQTIHKCRSTNAELVFSSPGSPSWVRYYLDGNGNDWKSETFLKSTTKLTRLHRLTLRFPAIQRVPSASSSACACRRWWSLGSRCETAFPGRKRRQF